MRNLPIALLLTMSAAAFAQEAAPGGPDMVKDYAGLWQVQDETGTKTCNVKLATDDTIGGQAIDIAEGCARTFPVMDEIAAWRIYENGDIVFADATRRERLRFYTPDETYVAVTEIDGIVRLVPRGND